MVFNYHDDLVNVKSVLVLVLVILLVVCWIQQPRNLPPGPWRFPIIGFVPQLMWSMFYKREELHMLATRLGQKYGKIFSFDLFGLVFVVINDFDMIKEASNNPLNSNKGFNNEFEYKVFGSTVHSYKHMTEYRKFALQTFRGFGIGKRSFEANIAAESEILFEELDAIAGKPFHPHQFFVNCTTNVLFAVVFGKRHDYDDENFRYLSKSNARVVHLLGAGLWSIMLPKYYPTNDTKELLHVIKDLLEFVDKRIEEHREIFDVEKTKDFIDEYLKAMEEAPKPDDPFSYLREDNMRALLYLMFFAGADTTSTTLDWCCLYMMAYPDIQKKIQEEMDAVVGCNRLPQVSDQEQLPYTRAAILEIQRHVTLVPLSAFHTATDETSLHGYRIPKGATIVSNIYGVMRDPNIFPEPDQFNPERFIDDHGKYFEREEVCPFGVVHSYKHMAEYRTFALHTFREFGIGKRSFEANIAKESEILLQELDAIAGKPFHPHQFFVNCTTNVFAVVFGKRHDYDDENFRFLSESNARLVHLVGSGGWSVMLPKYYPNNESKELLHVIKDLLEFVDKRIEEHREIIDVEKPRTS
ncbi:cytochrome P450 2J4-like [Amphiura filiformis]|uniref:cytochrome P450 2J4-like n=1 Tax=Amphiura filiformis TaxID=82378 RepID=UPI003B220F10